MGRGFSEWDLEVEFFVLFVCFLSLLILKGGGGRAGKAGGSQAGSAEPRQGSDSRNCETVA